jgi:cytochrome c oxidase subunit 2
MLHVACTVPTTLFSPAASPARAIFGLSLLTLSIVATIFLTVGGLLLYALVKYRERPNQEEREPVQLYGSNQIELSWTVIPILIVVVLFLATARVIIATERQRPPAGAGGGTPVLVGVSLSRNGCGHGQRTAHSHEQHGR